MSMSSAQPIRWRDHWCPPQPPRDTAEITGAPARLPERMVVPYPDPVSGRECQLTVWRYPAQAEPRRTMVLVHGFRGDHHGLALIADVLCAHGDDVELLVPDLPGFGDSPAFHDAEHSVAHDVEALNTALVPLLPTPTTAPERPWLLGHSFGSVVAAAWAARAPQAWAGLTLVNPISEPALSPGSSVIDRIAARAAQSYYETAARLPHRWGHALLAHPGVVWATGAFMSRTADRRILAYTHDQHQRYFSNFASRAMLVEAYRASTTGTVLEHAAALRLPVLLIAGDVDPLGSPESQHLLAARIGEVSPHVKLVMLEGSGHLIHYERPAEVGELMISFIETMASEQVGGIDPQANRTVGATRG